MDLGVSGSNFSRAPEETKREASGEDGKDYISSAALATINAET